MPRTALYLLLGLILSIAGTICYMMYDVADVELNDLESASATEQTYIRLHTHYRIYSHLIYAHHTGTDDQGNVDAVWYPVISTKHPKASKIEQLRSEHQSYVRIPQDSVPMVDDFAVLVKTQQFDTQIELPRGVERSQKIKGEVFRYTTLDKPERDIIKRAYPKMDLDRLVVLQHERVPAGLIIAMGLLFMGLPLLLVSLLSMLVTRRKQRSVTS